MSMYSYVPSLVVPYSRGFWLLPTECFARTNMNVFVWEGWIFLSVGVCDCLPLQGLELDAQMGLWQSLSFTYHEKATQSPQLHIMNHSEIANRVIVQSI